LRRWLRPRPRGIPYYARRDCAGVAATTIPAGGRGRDTVGRQYRRGPQVDREPDQHADAGNQAKPGNALVGRRHEGQEARRSGERRERLILKRNVIERLRRSAEVRAFLLA